MTESIPASILDGLTLEAVEWLPSGADTGLLRVRGRWAVGVGAPARAARCCARRPGARCRASDSLPDAPSARDRGAVWRGAYLVPAGGRARRALWLEWDERRALGAADAGAGSTSARRG